MHKLKFSMKSFTFSYLTYDLTDSLFMRYFRERKLILNLLYYYVSFDVHVQVKTSTHTSTSYPLVDINNCSFKVLVILLVGKLLEL